ncbi:MAG: tetratricopeptide repeat protein, partial [Blastocatellia bacterium]|nr:tetratricopeptide repeat protein [Blastocatellia bacterium]
ITKLGNLRGITVRPTRAVLKYEDVDIDPVAAGRELRVDSLLSGVIQKSGNQIRLTVQLTRVSDGASVWADEFEEDFTDIFDLQDAISWRVAQSLMPRLSIGEREAISRRVTENSQAYLLYMRGKYSVNKGADESLRKAVEYFEKALAVDPNFAAAYAWMAWTYTILGFNGLMSPDEAMPRARAALTGALELDGSSAEALTAQAFIKMHYDHDWPGAEQAFLRALDQNPQHLPARQWYAWWLLVMDRAEESTAQMERAYEIDPVTPSSSLHWGLHLIYSHRYERSIEYHQSLIELEPELVEARWYLAITYSLKGMHEEAIAEGKRALSISEENKYFQAYIYSAAGRRAEAMKILDELDEKSKTKYVSPYTLARIYVGLGERDRAFEMLERALRERDQKIFWLKVDPTFDPLRDDARYTEMMRRMKLQV